jgi:hypothetical protein
VTNPNPTNLPASVRQRLKNIADTSGRPFAEAVSVIREFALPVLEAVDETASFDKRWTAGKGWR